MPEKMMRRPRQDQLDQQDQARSHIEEVLGSRVTRTDVADRTEQAMSASQQKAQQAFETAIGYFEDLANQGIPARRVNR